MEYPNLNKIVEVTVDGKNWFRASLIMIDEWITWRSEEDEPRPICWTDDICWSENEDYIQSKPVIEWREIK
jgi:hypothetical protein